MNPRFGTISYNIGCGVKIFLDPAYQRVHDLGNDRSNDHILDLKFFDPMSRQRLSNGLPKFIRGPRKICRQAKGETKLLSLKHSKGKIGIPNIYRK